MKIVFLILIFLTVIASTFVSSKMRSLILLLKEDKKIVPKNKKERKKVLLNFIDEESFIPEIDKKWTKQFVSSYDKIYTSIMVVLVILVLCFFIF